MAFMFPSHFNGSCDGKYHESNEAFRRYQQDIYDKMTINKKVKLDVQFALKTTLASKYYIVQYQPQM